MDDVTVTFLVGLPMLCGTTALFANKQDINRRISDYMFEM